MNNMDLFIIYMSIFDLCIFRLYLILNFTLTKLFKPFQGNLLYLSTPPLDLSMKRKKAADE